MAFKFIDSNGLIPDEFLDTFGREFCKQEVLWKLKPNCNEFQIQPGTHVAYKTLAQVLNLSVEAVLELLKTFPAVCLDLMSRYAMCSGMGVRCHVPDWLRTLTPHFRLLNNSMKSNSSAVIDRRDLVRALCDSARVGLAEARPGPRGPGADAEDEASCPLLGPQAVAYFVERHRSSERQVLPAWRSLVKLCEVKLLAALATGDRAEAVPAALRPAAAERALADLALLRGPRVSQITVLTPAKLRTLVLLFRLIVAAKEIYDREERLQRGGEGESGTPGLYRGPPNVAGPAGGPDAVSASESRREADDFGDTTAERSLDNDLHTELDLEPDINIISSDTSDYETSDKYLEEYSENNIEVSILPNENRVKKSGKNIMEGNDVKYDERETDITSKSQNSNTGSRYPSKYWYEESKCNSSRVRRVVWALVYTDFMKRGRSASLISLQHRWVELLHRARAALLAAWRSGAHAHRSVHPLLLVVAHWFPEIVTENLPPWKRLVLERQIVLDSDIKDIIHKYKENDNILLNISESLTYPDLLEEYVNNKDVNYPQAHSKSNSSCRHLSYQIHKENHFSIIDNVDIVLEQEPQAQEGAINDELKVNNSISTMLDQIDPTKAKVSIIFDEDSDEDVKDINSTDVRETTPDLSNSHVKSEGGATYSGVHNQTPCAFAKCNKLTEMTMKNIEKELEDKLNYMNNPRIPPDIFVRNDHTELNEPNNDNSELHKDEQIVNYGFGSQDELSLLEPESPVIDEKLLNLSRVVVTPIEYLPEWKKHSRNGVIKCRNFSVKNFTKPLTANSIQLLKCTPHINTYKDRSGSRSDEYESAKYKNEFRIKFEDDDINNGIVYRKYIELYSMPEHFRKNRIKLTRKLNLSRTYFSLNFWSLDSNIELMKLCKPMAIKLSRSLPRVAKRVELPDINEVRRINRSILTAQVSPTLDTNPLHVRRSSASQEAVNSTNNNISSNSGTVRQTNNSISSALDSSEILLQLLTDYAIKTKIPKNSVIESVTKDITYSNVMDTIIETMRLADKNDSQNSTITCTLNSLQRTHSSETLTESSNTNISPNISATDPYSTIQKSTEEVPNNLQLNSINNSVTPTKIHISSNCTKELYVRHVQKMNYIDNINDREETRTPNVRELKEMILLLVKHFDNKMTDIYMDLNRRSINFHLKKFEKQQRALVRDISKLTKILPEYALSEEKESVVSDATETNQQKINNWSNWKQSIEHASSPSGDIDNTIHLDINRNSAFVDDDSEPNLVIAEESRELTDNIELNKSQCNKINMNKNIKESCNIRKKDKKIKKVKKKSKQSKKIPKEEKPILNEYQEWQRQKTMALKYFTIPMSDTYTSRLTSKDKIAQPQSTTTSTEQQTNACQTNISINRKNTENFATTLTEQQTNSCQTNISINRKNTGNFATTLTEQQSNSCQTNISINRKNTGNFATTLTEQQSNSCQTNISINRKNTGNFATTLTEQQSNSCQTNISINRKNTENFATTLTEQQSNSCQTNISIKRNNIGNFATGLTEQQSNSCQTNISIKRNNTGNFATTLTEQQSNSCQTNISIKRKNTRNFATATNQPSTASHITKRPKLHPNESDVVYISDTSSDEDVQITKCYFAKDTATINRSENNPDTPQPDIHQIDKIENGNKMIIFNDTSQMKAANQNVCVINTPVAAITQPVYLIINDSQVATATQHAINKTQDAETINSPLVFQVVSNATFPTLKQIVSQNETEQTQIVANNEKSKRLVQSSYTLQCQKSFNNHCKCVKCNNTATDDVLTCHLNAIHNLISQDSRTTMPSISLLKRNNRPIKEAITVEEYLSSNKKLTALIKVDGSQKLLFFCNKYIILTDVNIPSNNATYRTTFKTKKYKSLSEVLVPSDSRDSVLLLGPKKESDYIYCKCVKGASVSCHICDLININLPKPTNFLKIDNDYYKKMSENPIKYVRLNEKELITNSRIVLEENPDFISVSKLFFKKLTDTPPTYVRVLSALPDTATLRQLIRTRVLLYAFDVTQSQHYHTPLTYAQTAGHTTVDHSDDRLVKLLQWILN